MSSPEFDARKEQAPRSSFFPNERREFFSAVRREKQRQRERREESACRKRCAAIMSGRFRDADGYTDERALDAYAPHPSDGLAPRVFTPKMERVEHKAWARIETDKHKGRQPYIDACRAYLRLVERAERASDTGAKSLSRSGLSTRSLCCLRLGAPA